MRKKTNILLLVLLISNALFAQTIRFNNRYDVNGGLDGSRGIVETEGGYLIAGGTTYPDKLLSMFIDTLGNKKWEKTYQFEGWMNSYFGLAGSLIKTKDSAFVICGSVENATFDTSRTLFIKTNPNGDTIWSKIYNTNNLLFNDGRQCKQTTDGGFIICGDIFISNPGNISDFLLIKTDSNGVMQWWKNYGDNKIEIAHSVMQTPDKGYLIGGEHYFNLGGSFHADPKIVKTDSLGNFKWDKLMGSIYDDNPAVVCMTKDSCYMVAFVIGEYELSGETYRRINLNKLDTAGNIIWSRKYGPIYANNNLGQIKLLPDGGYIVCGFTYHPDYANYIKGWLLRLDENCDSTWYREYTIMNGNDNRNALGDVSITKDKGFISSGVIMPYNNGTQDVWVIKTDSVGCLEPNCDGVGIVELKLNKEMVVYPNPAQYKITFIINLTNIAETKLIIYNIQGQILLQKDLVQNNTEIDVSLLPQGIYIAKVSFGDGRYTQKKFVVVK